jgi:hypothetical protein
LPQIFAEFICASDGYERFDFFCTSLQSDDRRISGSHTRAATDMVRFGWEMQSRPDIASARSRNPDQKAMPVRRTNQKYINRPLIGLFHD